MAHPLLDVLAHDPATFVARGLRGSALVLLALGLALLAPLLLIVAVEMVGLLNARLRDTLHLALSALLLTLLFEAGLGRPLADHPAAAVTLASALGVGVAWAARRSAPLSLALALLALSALVVPAVFLTRPGVARLLASPSLPEPAAGVTSAAVEDYDVVLVVLDELPLSSLLAPDGTIDETLFPAFARLAATSTWYRNATASHDSTAFALPAILTGRTPDDPSRLPIAADHPSSLFTWLAPSHAAYVFETVTDVCPAALAGDQSVGAFGAGIDVLVLDLGVLYGHIVLPPAWSRELPPVDAAPAGFAPVAGAEDGWITRRLKQVNRHDHADTFRRFTRGLTLGGRPTFAFLHLMLPHQPWVHLPTGRRLPPHGVTITRGQLAGRWVDRVFSITLAFQRHLLQVGAVDRMLGELLDRLQDHGDPERTLLIVLADHGLSFRPGGHRRHPADADIDDVRRIPLFVRFPGQREGAVSERNVETIDVAPTIARVLGLTLPGDVSGRPVHDEGPQRPAKVMYRQGQEPYRSGPGPATRWPTADYRATAFGLRAGWDGVYAGPWGRDLLGRAVAQLPQAAASGLFLSLGDLDRLQSVDLASGHVPAYLEGRLWGRSSGTGWPQRVAIALDGTVAGIALPYDVRVGEARMAAILDDRQLHDGAHAVTAYSVDSTGRLAAVQLDRWVRKTTGARDTVLRSAAGTDFPVDSRGPMGSVEWASIDDGERLRLVGWAADLRAAARVRSIVVFAGDEAVWSGPAAEQRDRLVTQFDDLTLQTCGFTIVLPLATLDGPPDGRISVYAVGDDSARELRYEAEARWLRP